MTNDVERIARLEVMVDQHGKHIDLMSLSVNKLSVSVDRLVTNYSRKERNNIIIGGFICTFIGSIPQIINLFNK